MEFWRPMRRKLLKVWRGEDPAASMGSSGMVGGVRGVSCGVGGSTVGKSSAIGVDSQWGWGQDERIAEGSSGLSEWGMGGVETNPIVGTRMDQSVVSRRTTMRVREAERCLPLTLLGVSGITLHWFAKRTRRGPSRSLPVLEVGESVIMRASVRYLSARLVFICR